MAEDASAIAARTLSHYAANAQGFWEGTRDHDVSENVSALLSALNRPAPLTRSSTSVAGPVAILRPSARSGTQRWGSTVAPSSCTWRALIPAARCSSRVFFELVLPSSGFDAVFANASLFHVPRALLPRVLGELSDALVPEGVLFCSNPRAFDRDLEGWRGERYGTYLTIESWTEVISAAGFVLERRYLRPSGSKPSEQPWLAMVWRKPKG